MSPSPTPPSNLQPILDAALSEYKKKTGQGLLDHPIATELQRCDTVDAVLAILQDQARAFQQYKDGDQRLMKWIGPLTQVLFAFSGTLGVGDIGLAFPPARGIIAGIAVLLAAAKDVRTSHDALVELFEHIENLFKPLGVYIQMSLTTKLAEVFVKIMAEVLEILSTATKEVKRWRARIYFRRLLGRTDIEDALKKLECLIQEQIRMATTQTMKVTSGLKDDVKKPDLAMMNNINDIEWNQKGLDVRKWFSPPDPSTNHNTACEVYHNVPSMWFFGAGVFNDWMSNGSLLWIHGKSGSGKTILCSAIIQHIMKLRDAGQATLAYYYFDFRDKEKQNVRNFVTSVLVQLSESSSLCRDIIYRLYSAHGNGTRQPSNSALMDCLKEMLTVAAEHPVFIIVDAIDECLDTSGISTPREAILDVIKDLAQSHHPNLRFCVTSCAEADVETKLEPLIISAVSLHGQSGRKSDIANYVSSVVSLDENLRKWRDEDKKLVVEELSERADGMFQWVFCQLETLRCSAQPDVRRALEELPKTLYETYERVLRNINESDREHACRLLHCLAVAVRPLRVEELAEILSFDFDDAQGGIPTFRTDRRPENQEAALLSICSTLISIVDDGGSRVVQFPHSFIKEYLTSNHLASSTGDLSQFHIIPRSAHTIFAQVCLGFLLHLGDHIDDESLKGLPLANYAAQYWVEHAQFEDVASSLEDGMKSLFDVDKSHFAAWVRTYDMDGQPDGKSEPEMPNPLYYSALCGFPDLARHLAIKHPQHVNAIGGIYEFPVVAALCRRHVRVAEVLLEYGGTVDVRGRSNNTVLHKIIRFNEETIDAIQFLLERGADVNARREDLWTPLHLAVDVGELEVARMLLDHHADVNSQNDEGLTPLHLLSGREVPPGEDNGSTLAMLLLESGADVNVRAKDNVTPLHLACYNKRLEIVRVLLDRGANADAKNDEGRTPLQEVFRGNRNSQKDDVAVAQLLLERGAEAYARDKYHATVSDLAFCFGEQRPPEAMLDSGVVFSPGKYRDRTAYHLWLTECAADGNVQEKYDTILLHFASYHGRVEMAQVLLDHDVRVNAKNYRGETALHVASRGKHDSQEDVRVAQLLLERGGDVDAETNDHETSLHVASYHGRFDIAQVLLDHGAKANAEDDSLRTPLHQVSCGEYESQESGVRIAQLLLQYGVDVNASDKYLWTPLHFASSNGRPEIVQVLLDCGANANAKIDQGGTPLHVMSRSNHDSQDDIRVAQLLLDHGADVDARQKDNCTPLHGISYSGRPDIALVLLDHGANVNAEDNFLRTPLHVVSLGGDESQEGGVRIAQLLLERGVDVNARDKGGDTPLHLASASGRLEIARVLLDHATVKNDRSQTPSHLGLEERSVDVNAQRRDGQTPLHIASFFGRPEIAQMLLDHGAKANVEDNLLTSPLLHVAGGQYESQENGVRIVQLLLEHGANVNARDINHVTPLHSASSCGRLEIARILLEHATVKNDRNQDQSHLGFEERGVDVNAHRKDHWTPLHLASHHGKPEIARMLLDRGAKVNAEDDCLRTPLHHVAVGHYVSQEDGIRVSRLLLECGADANARDTSRQTPLHLASISGKLEIIQVLLEHATMKNDRGQNQSDLGLEEHGVDVNARKMDEWTPLHIASYNGRLEIVRALLDHGASVNAENDMGETPLFLVSRGVYSSQDDGARISQLLLDRGGNANAQQKDHWTPLHAASFSGRPEIVRILLDHGAEVNAENRQGKNSLDQVSRGEYGSQEDGARVAQLLLERGVDVNASDSDHWTPLHSASYHGRSEIVRVLLDHGANVNAENHEGETPLDLASRGKYHSQGDGARVVQLLLDRGADGKAQPKGPWTPLKWASYYGRPDIVRVLVDYGATVNLNAENSLLRTPLQDVSRGEYESQEDGVRVAQLLLERGVDVNAKNINRETALHYASSSGRIEIARVLLDHGAIANAETYDGETPLHAISRGKSDPQDGIRLVRLLMERGVDVNKLDKDGDTPLHYACRFGKLDIARELLDHGATATAENGQGETPLHVLSQGECEPPDGVRLAWLLLEHQADVNAPDTVNDTPLHDACSYGKLDIARLLLNHGAAANAENHLGTTPLHVISQSQLVSADCVRVARLLLEHGSDVNIQDKLHRTPLHVASLHGSVEIAQVLLDHGPAVNAKDGFGWTPLHLSTQYGGFSEERGIGVARLLLEHGADIHALDVNNITPLDHSSRRGWHKMAQVLLEHESKGKLA